VNGTLQEVERPMLSWGAMTGLVRALTTRRRTFVLAGAAVYALLLMVNPVLHDDLACHLKSPTHCNACTASPSASRVERMGPILPVLADAGLIEPSTRTVVRAAPAPTLPGRSPPA
jgi:hypothetical protein